MEVKLSEKERELIRLKAEELSIKKIARQMTLSETGVKKLSRLLCQKVGCRGANGLLVWAFRNEVIK